MSDTNHPTQEQIDQVTAAFRTSVEIAIKQLAKQGLTHSEVLHIMVAWGGRELREMLYEDGK